MKKFTIFSLLILLTLLSFQGHYKATSDFNSTPVKTFTDSKYWDKVELLRDSNPNIGQEKFITDNQQKDLEIIKEFNNNPQPNSQYFLLHYAPGWDTGTKPYPVILVHGAGSDADFFADPKRDGSITGLMQYLSGKGYKVFAVTFAHPHGDNYIQREILADAIQKVKSVTGASKVDIIAHSKGNMSARMYVSNVKKSWGVDFRKDVRRYIQLGAPNGGIDFTFRNPNMAWGIMTTGGFGPVPYTDMMIYGLWYDTTYHSIYTEGGAYPGQLQMLAKWDSVYPLNITQQDWYTTYHGGWGFASYSYGIDYAIDEGGNLISTLQNSPVDSTVQIAVLAGDYNYIDGIPWETTGSSDGLVFVDSATDTSGMTKSGAKVIAKDVYHLNHVELTYDQSAMDWVNTQLTKQ